MADVRPSDAAPVASQDDDEYSHVPIDDDVLNSDFVNDVRAKKSPPLRVCCFGSSAQLTPERYLREARHAGYVLARRGHVCVNGAGSFGCMAAMNDGACRGGGHIVGVIHEMWLVDNATSSGDGTKRDGTFHQALQQQQQQQQNSKAGIKQSHGGPHSALKGSTSPGGMGNELHEALSRCGSRDELDGGGGAGAGGGPIRELLVAGGNDLQERKRLLVENADGLLVLPGGPGTFDELWEMACARNIGLTSLPIVCVNVDGFYDSFHQILVRAYSDQLTKLRPDEIIHFEDNAIDAIRWIEEIQSKRELKVELGRRATPIRKTSVLNPPVLGVSDSWLVRALRRSLSWVGTDAAAADGAGGGPSHARAPSISRKQDSYLSDYAEEDEWHRGLIVRNGLVFSAGLAVGVLATTGALGRLRRS